MYNGLGCRNVSNLLIHDSFDWERIPYLFKRIDYRMLNPLYVEKVSYQRAKYRTLGIPFIDGGNILLEEKIDLKSSEMGILHIIKDLTQEDIVKKIETKKNEIQCIVNRGTNFGMSQYPGVEVFEDNVDLLKILT